MTVQTKHSQLAKKIESDRKQLESLVAQRDHEERNGETHGKREDYWRLKNAADALESQIATDVRELDRLARDLSWERQADNCESTIKSSKKAIASLDKEVSSLESSRNKLAGKLEKVKADIDQTLAKYEQAERDAGQAYAAAMAAGDEAAEQAAQTKLERAGDALADAQSKAKRQQPIVDTLTRELTSIDNKIADAKRQRDEQRDNLLSASRFKYGQAWDKAARELLSVGAQLAAVESICGGRTLEDLHIPLFDRLGSGRLGHRDIADLAASVDAERLVG